MLAPPVPHPCDHAPPRPLPPQVARQFADMHDTPARMAAKGVLRGVVAWGQARAFFAARLRRRLAEEALVRHVAAADSSITRRDAVAAVASWVNDAQQPAVAAQEADDSQADRDFLAWADSAAGRARVASELRGLRSAAAARVVADMLATQEGKEGLLAGLADAVNADGALAQQLRGLLQ